MRLIKDLSEKIGEEICDATEYAEMSLKFRDEYPTLAQALYTISTEEMKHMSMLHNEVASIIQKYKSEKGEPPAAMMAVYDYLHEQHIDDAARAKALQAMYAENKAP